MEIYGHLHPLKLKKVKNRINQPNYEFPQKPTYNSSEKIKISPKAVREFNFWRIE